MALDITGIDSYEDNFVASFGGSRSILAEPGDYKMVIDPDIQISLSKKNTQQLILTYEITGVLDTGNPGTKESIGAKIKQWIPIESAWGEEQFVNIVKALGLGSALVKKFGKSLELIENKTHTWIKLNFAKKNVKGTVYHEPDYKDDTKVNARIEKLYASKDLNGTTKKAVTPTMDEEWEE